MINEDKKKKKKRGKYPYYGSVFAPIFRLHSTTPRTTPDSPMGAGVGAAASPAATGGPGESFSVPTRARVMHEMRMAFGPLLEFGGPNNTSYGSGPTWTGYGVPNPMQVVMKGSTPQVSGPGFKPTVDIGKGGVYNFKKSPGLGFKTEEGWKVWKASLEIMEKNPSLPTSAVMQAGMARAGVRYGSIDAAECRLLEMGIEWYLSDPGGFAMANKDGSAGISGGVPATQLGSGAT